MDTFQKNVATRTDIAEIRSEMTDLAQFKSELPKTIAELKTDLVFRLGSLIIICTGILGVLMKS